MQPSTVKGPQSVLMTVDAVGGVWRYTIDLVRSLAQYGTQVVLVGLGPPPSPDQRLELSRLSLKESLWLHEPLDWMACREADILALRTRLAQIAEHYDVDLLHLNVPSQAHGLDVSRPVVAVSHSCVTTWWSEVRRTPLPDDLSWHVECNRSGLHRADLVLSPTRSHAEALVRAYGPLSHLRVLHNASELAHPRRSKEPFVLAAGRWWDEGKNGRVLDTAARQSKWPVLMAGSTRGPNGQALKVKYATALGQRPASEMCPLMGKAAIFASPARFEPFGLAALEAALRETALVLADIPTFRELWEGAAWFAAPDEPEAWTEAFNHLAKHHEQRVRLGRLARMRAEQFSYRRQTLGLLDAYRQASLLANATQPHRVADSHALRSLHSLADVRLESRQRALSARYPARADETRARSPSSRATQELEPPKLDPRTRNWRN